MDKIKNTLSRFIELWPGLWSIPTLLAFLWGSYFLFYFIDPSVGTYDLGILQAYLFVAATYITLNELIFLGIKYNDKGLWKYYSDDHDPCLETDINSITPWQRIKILYFWRAFLYALGAVIFLGLI